MIRGAKLDLRWLQRKQNEEAGALSNGQFHGFKAENRIRVPPDNVDAQSGREAEIGDKASQAEVTSRGIYPKGCQGQVWGIEPLVATRNSKQPPRDRLVKGIVPKGLGD